MAENSPRAAEIARYKISHRLRQCENYLKGRNLSNEKRNIEKSVTDVSDEAGKAEGKVEGAVRTAASAVSEKAAQAADSLRDTAGRVGEAVGHQYDRAASVARESFDQGRETARRWKTGVEETVQQRPLIAVLIAAAIGVVLALFFTNRRRD